MAKHLIQAAVAASQVVGRAFVKALRQEIAASQAAAARAGGGKTGAEHAATNTKLGITLEESKQILNIKDLSDISEANKNFEHLFKINDRTNGGTLYLQSKIFRAKERVDSEFEALNKHTSDCESTSTNEQFKDNSPKEDRNKTDMR